VSVLATVPVVTTWKSLESTPVTGSLKVTVKLTLLPLVAGPAGVVRLIDTT
jgi:hypothetical protein